MAETALAGQHDYVAALFEDYAENGDTAALMYRLFGCKHDRYLFNVIKSDE